MKKIIAALDGLKYSTATRDYAVNLAKIMEAHLVGLFMDDTLYSSYNVYELVVKKGLDEKKIKKVIDTYLKYQVDLKTDFN